MKMHHDSENLALLQHALSLNADLEMAVHLTNFVRSRARFPLSGFRELASIFEKDEGLGQCRDRTIRWKDMRRFVKPSIFPILDETDFLSKAYLALCIGSECHYHERRVIDLRGGFCKEPNDEQTAAGEE